MIFRSPSMILESMRWPLHSAWWQVKVKLSLRNIKSKLRRVFRKLSPSKSQIRKLAACTTRVKSCGFLPKFWHNPSVYWVKTKSHLKKNLVQGVIIRSETALAIAHPQEFCSKKLRTIEGEKSSGSTFVSKNSVCDQSGSRWRWTLCFLSALEQETLAHKLLLSLSRLP